MTQDALKDVGTVRHHSVDAQIDQSRHFLALIASKAPSTDEEPGFVRLAHEGGVDVVAARADGVGAETEGGRDQILCASAVGFEECGDGGVGRKGLDAGELGQVE